MNVEFWKKHQNTLLEDARKMLEVSHREVMALAETFSNEELFGRGAFLGRKQCARLLLCFEYFEPLCLGDEKTQSAQKKL